MSTRQHPSTTLLLLGCGLGAQLAAAEPTLVFRSGFGTGVTTFGESTKEVDIRGDDGSDGPSHWVNDLEGTLGGFFRILYAGGTADQRRAELVADPVASGNRCLSTWIREANDPFENNNGFKGRVTSNWAMDEAKGFRDFYTSIRMYITPDFRLLLNSSQDDNDYLILAEYWNESGETDHQVFRIGTDIKRNNGKAYLGAYCNSRSDTGNVWTSIWNKTNNDFALPIGTWMTVETRIREGDASHGLFHLAITPAGGTRTDVIKVTNFTHHPDQTNPNGLSHPAPFKIYSHAKNIDIIRAGGGRLEVLWDDFEVWTNRVIGGEVTANVAPTVAVTAPTAGASFTAPAGINLSATASDSDGSIAKVEFLHGSTTLGEDTTSPYTCAWQDVAAGTYTLTVRATDNQGATATASSTVTVAAPQPTLVEVGTGRTEAEMLTLDGMEVSDESASSNDKVAKILATGTAGSARAAFSGSAGLYDITVGYIDESDGIGTWNLLVDGTAIATWTGTGNTGSGSVSLWQHLEHQANHVQLQPGSIITVSGVFNVGEYCRTDWIDIQAATPPAAPVAAPTQFTAIADGSTVSLFWVDRSTDETGFRIERAGADGVFTTQATVAAGTERWTQTGLAVGAYVYRLRAVRGETTSDPVVLDVNVVTAGAGDGIPDQGSSTGCGGGSGVAGLAGLLAFMVLGLRRRWLA